MKNTKKVLLRIYSRHDLDLVALRNIKEFDINRAIKYVLHEYIKGTPVKMQIPIIPDFTNTKFKSSYTIFLSLNEEEDSDIISFLDTIKPYYRNAAIKTIFRASLLNLPLSVFNKRNSVFTNEYVNALNKSIEDEVSSFNFYKPTLKKKCYSSKSTDENIKPLKKKEKKINNVESIANTNQTLEVIESKANNINTSSKTDNTSFNTVNINSSEDKNNLQHIVIANNFSAQDAPQNNLNHFENISSSKLSFENAIASKSENNDNYYINSDKNSLFVEDNINNNNANNINDTDDNEDDLDDVDMDFMDAFSSMLNQNW